jgi:hypothetical protein
MRPRTVLAACVLALVSATFSLADEFDRKIEVTFANPVAVPAVHQAGLEVLPAGTYVLKIFDSSTNRHIVQIYKKGETEMCATIVAVPAERMKVTDKVVLTFRETAAGEPYELRTMFYPGRTLGEEFVYWTAESPVLPDPDYGWSS